MMDSKGQAGPLVRLALDTAPRLFVLPMISAVLLGLSFLVVEETVSVALVGAALSILLTAALLAIIHRGHIFRSNANLRMSDVAIRNDPDACFLTDSDGRILRRNAIANRRFGPSDTTLGGALANQFSDPGSLIRRLVAGTSRRGHASEDVTSPLGNCRLNVHRVGPNLLKWRVQEFEPAPGMTKGAGNVILTVGRSNAILYMSDAARDLIGARPKSLEGVFETLPVISGETQVLRTADGPRLAMVIELSAGGGRREYLILPDDAARALPQSETRIRDLLSTLPVPLLITDTKGKILMANAPAATLLDADPPEGMSLGDLTEGLGRATTDWLAEARQHRSKFHSEFLRLRNREREVYVQVSIRAMALGGRDVILAMLNDATELKTLEAQFVQSQKMQAIGQLAGGVAHDFNNLLTAISGHCDLLLLRHDPGGPDYADLIQIHQNVNRAAALIRQLLAYSRKQTLRPELLDLRDTLGDLTHLLNRLVGEKVTLNLSHDPLLRPFRADKRQLEQVVMNLVVNARDAMPDGGRIDISTEMLRLTDPLCRDRAEVPPGDYVCVKVRDTGQGIASDKITKIFEPFFTTKNVGEGTGLGLSTAYGIVKQTGGFIFVDSDIGQGSRFTLMFPIRDTQEPLTDAPDAENSADITAPVLEDKAALAKPGQTLAPEGIGAASAPFSDDSVVLLVEDEAPVRAFASRALKMRGLTVLEADCAEAALDLLKDETIRVDLFVTDVVMPGMDGPSWVKKALETRPGVGVVFVSGYAEDNFNEAQLVIPNSVFLPKPFSLTELTDTVQRQLH